MTPCSAASLFHIKKSFHFIKIINLGSVKRTNSSYDHILSCTLNLLDSSVNNVFCMVYVLCSPCPSSFDVLSLLSFVSSCFLFTVIAVFLLCVCLITIVPYQ